MNRLLLTAAAALALAGCMALPRPVPPDVERPPALVSPPVKAAENHYRCDNGMAFDLRFGEDSAMLDMGAKGAETLGRDAGGVTPQQSVYSNAHLRAEFGLGDGNRQALLHYLSPVLDVRCTRD